MALVSNAAGHAPAEVSAGVGAGAGAGVALALEGSSTDDTLAPEKVGAVPEQADGDVEAAVPSLETVPPEVGPEADDPALVATVSGGDGTEEKSQVTVAVYAYFCYMMPSR
eukprot:g5846.t1